MVDSSKGTQRCQAQQSIWWLVNLFTKGIAAIQSVKRFSSFFVWIGRVGEMDSTLPIPNSRNLE